MATFQITEATQAHVLRLDKCCLVLLTHATSGGVKVEGMIAPGDPTVTISAFAQREAQLQNKRITPEQARALVRPDVPAPPAPTPAAPTLPPASGSGTTTLAPGVTLTIKQNPGAARPPGAAPAPSSGAPTDVRNAGVATPDNDSARLDRVETQLAGLTGLLETLTTRLMASPPAPTPEGTPAVSAAETSDPEPSGP